MLALLGSGPVVQAQEPSYFVGALGGMAILSGDPAEVTTADGFAVSQYAPESGAAANLFAGIHFSEYVTLQGNYVWNRNRLAIFLGDASASGVRVSRQERTSSHQIVVGDLLLYFRERYSRFRPYLSAGLGVARFETDRSADVPEDAEPAPIASTDLFLRVAVGIDVTVAPSWRVRYSFSENLGPNPISNALTPPGSRGLMNFQNLVGLLYEF